MSCSSSSSSSDAMGMIPRPVISGGVHGCSLATGLSACESAAEGSSCTTAEAESSTTVINKYPEFIWNLSSGGVVVRALASHQCDPGSIFRLGVKCGLSLLVLYSATRGFSPATPVSPLLKNLHFIKFDLYPTPQALSFKTYRV